MKRLIFIAFTFIFICTLFIFQSAIYAEEGDRGNNIRPYGNLYVFFGYINSETYLLGLVKETDKDTLYNINDNSNIGFNFSYKRYKGVFELGISDYEGERKVKIRKAYGIYNFGFGTLTIGQAWNPYVKWSHESANYYRSEAFGALYEDPTTQLKITSNFGLPYIDMYFDVIKPYVPSNKLYINQSVDNPEASTDASNTEYMILEVERELTTRQPLDNIQSMIPKLAVGCEYKNKLIKATLGAAYNAYKIERTSAVVFNKEWIVSYLFYLNSALNYKKYSMNLNAGYAVNPANFGIAVMSAGNTTYNGGASASLYNIATGKYEIKDTWNLQGYIEFGYQITNSIIIHLGYGYSLVDYPIVNTKEDEAAEYYLNAKFNLGGLIALTPAFSYHDYKKDMDGKKEGKDYTLGVLATISFY